jgi:hypothetical protein
MVELKSCTWNTIELFAVDAYYCEISFLEDCLKVIPLVFEVETLPVLESGHDLEYMRA